MQPNDVLIQASSIASPDDDWRVIHRSAGPIGSLAWIQALSVARRIAREEKVDIYRANSGSSPMLYESHRLPE
jgi:hypothetical protein